MRAKFIFMISSSSLSAFSSAITTGSLNRPGSVRLASGTPLDQQQRQPATQAVAPTGTGAPAQAPTRLMPRGSLLNLSV